MGESARNRGPEAAPRARSARVAVPEWDRLWAVLLLVFTGIGVAGFFVASRFGIGVPCWTMPGCEQRRVDLGEWMLDWLPLLIYLVVLVVTIVLWKLGRRVVWVSLAGIGVFVVVFVVGSLLARGQL